MNAMNQERGCKVRRLDLGKAFVGRIGMIPGKGRKWL